MSNDCHGAKVVRRVSSRFEDVVCDCPKLSHVYGKPILSSRAVAQLLYPLLEHEVVEVLVCLLLDGDCEVFGYVEVSRGTLTRALGEPREIFGPALRMGACSIVLAHNHPSTNSEPSFSDKLLTRSLIRVGKLVGIPIVEHVIIGKGRQYTGLAQELDVF